MTESKRPSPDSQATPRQASPQSGSLFSPHFAPLFAKLPALTVASEEFSPLFACAGMRIERIVSSGQCSPPGFWYDQAEGEWVIVLAGAADLRFADETAPRRLCAGDYVYIAPHRRHRVDWTATGESTIWLAVFHTPQAGGDD